MGSLPQIFLYPFKERDQNKHWFMVDYSDVSRVEIFISLPNTFESVIFFVVVGLRTR